jgi:hypothetical protein
MMTMLESDLQNQVDEHVIKQTVLQAISNSNCSESSGDQEG